VFARGLRYGQPERLGDAAHRQRLEQRLQPGWEYAPFHIGGRVRSASGQPFAHTAVRLVGSLPDGETGQIGPTVLTDEAGRYLLHGVAPGRYTLVVEVSGQAPHQQSLSIVTPEPGEVLPDIIKEVEVIMP